jgi:predicted NUDIX family phosphoesterase
MSEQVLCFPEYLLQAFGGFDNSRFIKDEQEVGMALGILLSPQNLKYIDRDYAENEPAWKQVIPYCVLREDGTGKVFAYQRTKKGAEARLHDKWSIGVGGHINPIDGHPGEAYEAAMGRELQEEVGMCYAMTEPTTVLGMIYDSTNAVGKVHFGVVHQLTVVASALKFKDSALSNGSFRSVDSVKTLDLENWSRIVADSLL